MTDPQGFKTFPGREVWGRGRDGGGGAWPLLEGKESREALAQMLTGDEDLDLIKERREGRPPC